MNNRIASLVCIVVGSFVLAPALVLSSWWLSMAAFVFVALGVYFDHRAYPEDHD